MKKYETLYSVIKQAIEKGELKPGDRIISVRRASAEYGFSLTTVKSAYFDLCADGYIISRERSGYYVSDMAKPELKRSNTRANDDTVYDFCAGGADSDAFDTNLWQKYVKNALRQKEKLLSYSEPQGEYDLRCAISEYIRKSRNVIASPDNIVIGAGVQPLLFILASLLKKGLTVSFPDDSFMLGRAVFSDYGFTIHTRDKDADVIYVSPSHMTRWGDVMPVKRRLELIDYSEKSGSLVIEDDYENEFLYNVKPTPSLYALGRGNIVYIGSFSAMLLPGIRISFMVLTDPLAQIFRNNMFKYAQTASKTEQIALCGYIRDGHIFSQIRKARRIYSAKTKIFVQKLRDRFKEAEIEIGENTIQITLRCPFKGSSEKLTESGIRAFVEGCENGSIMLVISPSGIPQNKLDNAADALVKALLVNDADR